MAPTPAQPSQASAFANGQPKQNRHSDTKSGPLPSPRPRLVRPAAFPSLQMGERIGDRWAKLPEDDLGRILNERLWPDEVIGGPDASRTRVLGFYTSPEEHDLPQDQREWYAAWYSVFESQHRDLGFNEYSIFRMTNSLRNVIILSILETVRGTSIDEAYAYTALLHVPEAAYRKAKATGKWVIPIDSVDDDLIRKRMALTKTTDPEEPILDEVYVATLFLMDRGLPGTMLGKWQRLPGTFKSFPKGLITPAVTAQMEAVAEGSEACENAHGGNGAAPDSAIGQNNVTRAGKDTGFRPLSTTLGEKSNGNTLKNGSSKKDITESRESNGQSKDADTSTKATSKDEAHNGKAVGVGPIKRNGEKVLKNSTTDDMAFSNRILKPQRHMMMLPTTPSLITDGWDEREALRGLDNQQSARAGSTPGPVCFDEPLPFDGPVSFSGSYGMAGASRDQRQSLTATEKDHSRASIPQPHASRDLGQVQNQNSTSKRSASHFNEPDESESVSGAGRHKSSKKAITPSSLRDSSKRRRLSSGKPDRGTMPHEEARRRPGLSSSQNGQAPTTASSLPTGPPASGNEHAPQHPYLRGGADIPSSSRNTPRPVRADGMRISTQRKETERLREALHGPKKSDSRRTQSFAGYESPNGSTDALQRPTSENATPRPAGSHRNIPQGVSARAASGQPSAHVMDMANAHSSMGFADRQQVQRPSSQEPRFGDALQALHATRIRGGIIPDSLDQHQVDGSTNDLSKTWNTATWANEELRATLTLPPYNSSPNPLLQHQVDGSTNNSFQASHPPNASPTLPPYNPVPYDPSAIPTFRSMEPPTTYLTMPAPLGSFPASNSMNAQNGLHTNVPNGQHAKNATPTFTSMASASLTATMGPLQANAYPVPPYFNMEPYGIASASNSMATKSEMHASFPVQQGHNGHVVLPPSHNNNNNGNQELPAFSLPGGPGSAASGHQNGQSAPQYIEEYKSPADEPTGDN